MAFQQRSVHRQPIQLRCPSCDINFWYKPNTARQATHPPRGRLCHRCYLARLEEEERVKKEQQERLEEEKRVKKEQQERLEEEKRKERIDALRSNFEKDNGESFFRQFINLKEDVQFLYNETASLRKENQDMRSKIEDLTLRFEKMMNVLQIQSDAFTYIL
jgi:hypothetical protein